MAKKKKMPNKTRAKIDIEKLAGEQGVKPIADFDKFMKGWSDPCPDETADEMIATIRAWRREGRKRPTR
jgi:hypothetical protein